MHNAFLKIQSAKEDEEKRTTQNLGVPSNCFHCLICKKEFSEKWRLLQLKEVSLTKREIKVKGAMDEAKKLVTSEEEKQRKANELLVSQVSFKYYNASTTHSSKSAIYVVNNWKSGRHI